MEKKICHFEINGEVNTGYANKMTLLMIAYIEKEPVSNVTIKGIFHNNPPAITSHLT